MAGNGSSSSLESGHVDAYAPLRLPEEHSAEEVSYLERYSSGGTAKGAYGEPMPFSPHAHHAPADIIGTLTLAEPFYRRMVRRLSGISLTPDKSKRASAIDVTSEAGQEHPLSSQSRVAASDSAGNAPVTSDSTVAASEVTLPQVQSRAPVQADAPMSGPLAADGVADVASANLVLDIAQIAEQQKRPRADAAVPWFPIDSIVCCSPRRKDKSTRGQECFPGISEEPPGE